MAHPTAATLSGYALGQLSDQDLLSTESHLDFCLECQERLSTLNLSDDTLLSQLAGCGAPEAFGDEPELAAMLSAGVRAPDAAGEPVGSPLDRSTTSPTQLLRQLTEYKIIGPIGEGGMGQVFAAHHIKLDRKVAIKLVRRDLVADSNASVRFLLEMRAVGKLNHPNIVRAFDARELDAGHCLIVEMVDGVDLASLARSEGILPTADASELVRQAALGLQHAHEHGIIHRDIKPSNLMLANDGVVKVLDLGLARLCEVSPSASVEDGTISWAADASRSGDSTMELTRCNQILGSIDYMAPEQCIDARKADTRSDVYGLGVTLYKLLTGRVPYAGRAYDSLEKKVDAIVDPSDTPISIHRGDLPPALVELLRQMLAKNPDQRIQSAAEVATRLTPFAAGHDVSRFTHRTEVSKSCRSDSRSAGREIEAVSSRVIERLPTKLRVPLAAAALATACVLVLLTLRTSYGELIVEVPPDARDSVCVQVQKGNQIFVADAECSWSLSLVEGTWNVELRDPTDSFELDDDHVTIRRGDKQIVRVAQKVRDSAKPAQAAVAAAPLERPFECTLYTMVYEIDDNGRIPLGNVPIEVMPNYVGHDQGVRIVDDRITIIAKDAKNSFWPIIMKLSVAEATRLRDAVMKTLSEKRRTKSASPAPGKMECDLYTKPYQRDENGMIKLPDTVTWKILPQYRGSGPDGPIVDERLTFIVDDPENKFWPFIAKMPVKVAEAFQRDLTKNIAHKNR